MIYLELFISFATVGLFCIGGGYAALPLIQHQVMEVHQWMTMEQFLDIITISQMTPGPIAINAATFVGTNLAGLPGAIIATIGSVTPSCIIVLILAVIYYRYRNLSVIQSVLSGLRPAVVALIASAGLSIAITAFFKDGTLSITPTNIDWIALIIFCASLFVLRKYKKGPVTVMVCAGILGTILYLIIN